MLFLKSKYIFRHNAKRDPDAQNKKERRTEKIPVQTLLASAQVQAICAAMECVIGKLRRGDASACVHMGKKPPAAGGLIRLFGHKNAPSHG